MQSIVKGRPEGLPVYVVGLYTVVETSTEQAAVSQQSIVKGLPCGVPCICGGTIHCGSNINRARCSQSPIYWERTSRGVTCIWSRTIHFG